MNSKKLISAMAVIVLVCGGAAAQGALTAGAQATPVTPPPEARSNPAAQTKPPPRRPPRRSVEQILTPTPRILGSAVPADAVQGPGMMAGAGAPVSAGSGTLTYGPTLETRVPPPSRAAPAGAVGTNPATCAGPNCLDGNGQRLGTGIGTTAITPQGRLCTKGLVGVQCF